MDKRKHTRFKTRQFAKVCGKLGVVNDISDSGVQISTAMSPTNRRVDISIETNGQLIQINGIIQWIKRKQRVQAFNEMGVVIRNVTPEFLQFVHSCH